MARVLVLGGSGMLGAMTTDLLARDSDLDITATVRDRALGDTAAERVPEAKWVRLDAEDATGPGLIDVIDGHDYVINAIGVIKSYIHDDVPREVERATVVNAMFPHALARAAEKVGCSVVQIATDCVYSGQRGQYLETDPQDPLDAYGKTKSLGEVNSNPMHHIRCSIIGPEPKRYVSLLEWFLAQPRNGSINGFTNHIWNGVTTLHFAKACLGIVKERLELPLLHHFVPAGVVTKAELVRLFARSYGRADVSITDTEAPVAIDRTLRTDNQALNERLWSAAGYRNAPTISDMVEEMSAFTFRLGNLLRSGAAGRAS